MNRDMLILALTGFVVAAVLPVPFMLLVGAATVLCIAVTADFPEPTLPAALRPAGPAQPTTGGRHRR
ncbi:hypothetical protein [Nocardia sp. SC052]|uniref:hypothetical protein n=1 Tax=Nocardia sichangensis TaxID=3385975 RepID=UPI0039A16752